MGTDKKHDVRKPDLRLLVETGNVVKFNLVSERQKSGVAWRIEMELRNQNRAVIVNTRSGQTRYWKQLSNAIAFLQETLPELPEVSVQLKSEKAKG